MARETMAIRLDAPIRKRLDALARRRGRSASDIVRTALETWLDTEEGTAGQRPYEALADLVGSVRSVRPRPHARRARRKAPQQNARQRKAAQQRARR